MVKITVEEFGKKMSMHEANTMIDICLEQCSVNKLREINSKLNVKFKK